MPGDRLKVGDLGNGADRGEAMWGGVTMLVINLREGESLLIGDTVEVRLLEVRGTRVQLGVTAPRDVAVWRGELRPVKEPESPRRLEHD